MHGDVTGYRVLQNETMIMDVNSSTNSLTFTALIVPDEMDSATLVVMVAAISRFGVGPTNETTTTINGNDNKVYLILT